MRDALFRTRITELFDIRHPILCGGMGPGVSDAAFVAAVVRAGGMGFIAAAYYPDHEKFRDELRRCKSLAGGHRFGVNMYLSRFRATAQQYPAHIRVMAEEGVDIVETAGLSPEPLLAQLREAGVTVMHKVASLRHGVAAARLGVDAVCLIGSDAAGHIGARPLGTMINAAELPLAIRDIPVVVGGGIGTGQQVVGALAMGVDGVLIASRMMVAEELWIHDDVKRRIAASRPDNTMVVMQRMDNPIRVLENDTARDILALEESGERDASRYKPLLAGTVTRAGFENGNISRGMIGIGPAITFAGQIEPVEVIFDRLIDEAAVAHRRLNGLALAPAQACAKAPSTGSSTPLT